MIQDYAELSTKKQNLDTQIEQLTRFDVDETISEKISGVAENK